MLIVKFIAILTSGLFSGAAIYVNAVEHPARMSCGTDLAIKQWRPSYQRATIMQASLAFISLISSLSIWYRQGDTLFLISGLLIGSVIPFTLLVILPTNKKLEKPGVEANVPEAERLLRRWNRLHLIRSILALCAFVAMLVGVLR
jgi:uncharacterized membrane protein